VLIYDLVAFPVDQPMTADEAAAEVERLAGGLQFGFRRDHRLDAFEAWMEERWPGLAEKNEWDRPFEFDPMRHHIFIGLPVASAVDGATVVAEGAWTTGLALFDPQRHLVGLPAPLADAPLGTDGIAEFIQAADAEEAADAAKDAAEG
jgi:hypothetical protein